MEYWQKAKLEAEEKRKFPLIGKKVRRKAIKKWEYGVIELSSFDDSTEEYFIRYNDNTLEQLNGLPYQTLNEKTGEYED
jgi:hypothetical protein